MDRLHTICNLISENSVVCDIGCDHAYLLLLAYPKIKRGFACDIAEKPLRAAIKTINEHQIHDKITPILSNGLKNVPENSFDTVVIAGMGGELICDILADCNYIKDEKYKILLQPMTKASDLRKFLYQNGFSIINEVISIEERRFYTILEVKYTNIVQNLDIIDCFVSESLTKDKNFDLFLNHHINRTEIILNSMKNSQNNENSDYYNKLLQKLKEYKNA